MACCACVLGNKEEARELLGKAIELGGDAVKTQALNDPDLQGVWVSEGEERWHAVLDVHQDCQGVAGFSWGGLGGFLLLHHPTCMPRILPTHGPRAFGEAFALGLEGIELFVP